jgi:hypothetical protein
MLISEIWSRWYLCLVLSWHSSMVDWSCGILIRWQNLCIIWGEGAWRDLMFFYVTFVDIYQSFRNCVQKICYLQVESSALSLHHVLFMHVTKYSRCEFNVLLWYTHVSPLSLLVCLSISIYTNLKYIYLERTNRSQVSRSPLFQKLYLKF